MKKILIVNEGVSPNLGDQLINVAIQKILKEEFALDIQIDFHSYSLSNENIKKRSINESTMLSFSRIKRYVAKSILYRYYARKKWLKLKSNLFSQIRVDDYDILMIGGGQLLNNSWLYPFLFDKWTHLFREKRIITVGIGIGKSFNWLDKILVKKALQRCEIITVRDSHSKNLTTNKFKLSCEVLLDPVFKISDYYKFESKNNTAIILPASYENVYLSHNVFMGADEYLKIWLDRTEEYLKIHNRVIISITDLVQDRKIFDDLKSILGNDSRIDFIIPQDYKHLLKIIGTSNAVFSARMHALIVGYSYGCICEVFPISEKLKIFEKDIIKNKENSIGNVKNKIFKNFSLLVQKIKV